MLLLLLSENAVDCKRRYLKYGFQKHLVEIGASLHPLSVVLIFVGGVAEADRPDFKCSELADSLGIQMLVFRCLLSRWVKTGKLYTVRPKPTLNGKGSSRAWSFQSVRLVCRPCLDMSECESQIRTVAVGIAMLCIKEESMPTVLGSYCEFGMF